jgi:hypothetical protein
MFAHGLRPFALALPLAAFALFISLNALRLSAIAEEVNASTVLQQTVGHPANQVNPIVGTIHAVHRVDARQHQVRPLRKRTVALPGREISLAANPQGEAPKLVAPLLTSLSPGGNYADSKPLQQTRWITQIHQKLPESEEAIG